MMKMVVNRLLSVIMVFSWAIGLAAPTPVVAMPASVPLQKPATQEMGLSPTVLGPFSPIDTSGMGPVSSALSESSKTQQEEIQTNLPLPKAFTNDNNDNGDPVIDSNENILIMPETILNFEGTQNVDGVYPPDTTGDVGPNHYVQMVNMRINIFDKTGVSLYEPFPPGELWPGGNVCHINNDGDVIVLYDQLADRWLISQFAFPNYPDGPYYECIGISKTPVPTNNPNDWWLYSMIASNTDMNDYPKLAVWPDAYYMTANQFTGASFWGGAGVWALEKAKMLNGQPFIAVYFNLYPVNSKFGGMLPSDLGGSNLPPAGSPGYFVEVDDGSWFAPQDTMRIWEFHVDWTSPASSTFGIGGQPNAVLPVANWDPACTSGRSCVPQPVFNIKLDGLADRLMYRLVYRNFGDHEALLVNHTVKVDATGRTGVRWYEVRDPGNNPNIYQQGTFAPNDGIWRWMGSITFDHVGNIALAYSGSSSSVYPSIYYAGRLASDPLGEMTQGESLLYAGTGSQIGTGSRWGDYSDIVVDPVDDCTFWITNEYLETTSFASWRTRIGSFKFPNCSLGSQGTLSGTVTGGEALIENATIQASSPLTETTATTTDELGHYSMVLKTGTYKVDVSAYGYVPQNVSDVVVNKNATTTQDFDLIAADIYTVSGIVSDATTGWPLYAQIIITGYPGDPIWTDPETGEYSIQLSGEIEYTFNVSAFSSGYNQASLTVGPLHSNQIVDIELSINQTACSAPGYDLHTTGLYEPFSTTAIPIGWTVVSNGGTCTWRFDDPALRGNLTGGLGNFAIADSDDCGLGSTMNTFLLSPVVDLSDLAIVNLSFDYDYHNFINAEIAAVDITADGGATWINLVTWNTEQRGPAAFSQDVSALVGSSTQAQLRFRYVAPGWDWWWQVDNISMGEKECLPLAGGLVVGTVTDLSTGNGVNDVTVANQAGFNTKTVATPLDLVEDDGFYTLFSPAGSQVFTATLPEFEPVEATVNVLLDSTVRQDFNLGSGVLSYTPDAIDVSIPAGTTTSETLVLSNTGTLAVSFELLELNGGVVLLAPFDPPSDWVVRPFRQELPSSVGTGVPPSPTDWELLPAGDVIDSWMSAVPVWGITSDSMDGTVWVSSPGSAWDGFDKLVEYTPNGTPTRRESAHNVAIMPHTNGPADMTFNWNTGKIWVMNTNSGIANCVYEVDPDRGYTGNKICPQSDIGFTTSQRGLAYDPAGDTYFAGGWNDFTIYRFAPDGTLLAKKNVGLNIAGLAFNPETNHLFVLENGGANNIYILNVIDNYAPVGTFHIAGMSLGSGLELACDGSLWAIDNSNNMIFLADSGEAASLCEGIDIPWLTSSPMTGTIAVDGSQDITLGLDAKALQPGVYDGQLKFIHDSPHEVPNLPVQLTVTVPPTWGRITGHLETTGYCDTNPAILEGIEVVITTVEQHSYHLTTDVNGAYQLWMPVSESPINIDISPPGYAAGHASNITLTEQSTTIRDFSLRLLLPCVTTDPTSIITNVKPGQSIESTLLINNLGGASATFTVTEQYANSPILLQPVVDSIGGDTFINNEVLAAENMLCVGSNYLDHTSSSNLAAADCGLIEPTRIVATGLPDRQLDLNAPGELMTGDVPWLGEDPITGTVAADSSFQLEIIFTPAPTMTAAIYTATLKIELDDPVVNIILIPVEMNVWIPFVPKPSFTSNSPILFGDVMVFNNTSIPGIPVETDFEWDFGDGTPPIAGTMDPISHKYPASGTYTVSLTACNIEGCDTYEADVTVLSMFIFMPIINRQ